MRKDPSTNYNWMIGPNRQESGENTFIRKGEIGDWRNHFSAEQSRNFDEMYKEKMSGSDLHF